MMTYRSIADLNARIVEQMHRLPRDIDLVVGVPRSGLLAANLFALYRNIPLADVDGFLEGRLLGGGDRLRFREFQDSPRRILVIDDSIVTGSAMSRVRERLSNYSGSAPILYAAVFGCEGIEHDIDFVLERTPRNRIFEWNVFHRSLIGDACVDIDGVLCRDPTEEENDDSDRYVEFLKTATPLHLPSPEIGWLVTSRLEKYREYTEGWMAAHGIRYKNLIMRDLPNAAARRADIPHGEYKAGVILEVGARFFIESSEHQARQIARLSGKPVFCVSTRSLIQSGDDVIPQSSTLRRAVRKARRIGRKAVKRVLNR